MADPSKTPGLGDTIRDWAYQTFGVLGLVALSLLGAALYVYKEWDKVRKSPGIPWLRDHLSRVPRADPARFSVLVAHLKNDDNSKLENLILEELKECPGIRVQRLNRLIPFGDKSPEAEEVKARDLGHRYLKSSGASVLICGSVLTLTGQPVLKLYLIPTRVDQWKWNRYDAPRVEDQLRLPHAFWSDLADFLRVLVASYDLEFRAERGRYVADRLPAFIARTQQLIDGIANRPGWDADVRGAVRMILGDALQILGHQSGSNEPLQQAIAVYRAALQDRAGDKGRLDWAMTQHKLGNALQELGGREVGTGRLEEALTAYNAALQERTPEQVPFDWANTQNSFGVTLLRLAEREVGMPRLEEAISAFRAALTKWTRERMPLDWAMAHSNLGAALIRLAQRDGGTGRLEEAIAAFRDAIQESTRKVVPLDWAGLQNNLGLALLLLAEREPERGTSRLDEAIAAFREALKEWNRERMPVSWATAQHSLGLALTRLGEGKRGVRHLRNAVVALTAAVEVWDDKQDTYNVRRAQADLKRAEALLRERQEKPTR
jgi:tetratricopeptide (TPR) repeat protein